MTCQLCAPPRPPREGELVIMPVDWEALCYVHRAEEEEAIAAIRRDHPDGHCTDTCGCMSLEELEEALDLK